MDKLHDNNKSTMYVLSGKYMVGTELAGLELSNASGYKRLLKLSDVHGLIKRGLVYGCTLIEHEGNTLIKSAFNKIAELPLVVKESTEKVSKYRATARIFKDRILIGYKVTDVEGKEYTLSKDKVWDIARNNGFSNVSASVSNGTKILRGIELKLIDLPSVKV